MTYLTIITSQKAIVIVGGLNFEIAAQGFVNIINDAINAIEES